MLVIVLIGFACYGVREYMTTGRPWDPRILLSQEDEARRNRWRWVAGPLVSELRAMARSVLGLEQEMKDRRSRKEKQARLDYAFRRMDVDSTRWSEPTPGQVTMVKAAFGKWKVVDPVRVYRQLHQQLSTSRLDTWRAYGDLDLVTLNDGSGEVYLTYVRERNDAEQKAEMDWRHAELQKAAEFVQRTGKAPPGWIMKRDEPPMLVGVPGGDPVPVPTVVIMPEADPSWMTFIAESTIKCGYKP
jgi:hypothetical protein